LHPEGFNSSGYKGKLSANHWIVLLSNNRQQFRMLTKEEARKGHLTVPGFGLPEVYASYFWVLLAVAWTAKTRRSLCPFKGCLRQFYHLFQATGAMLSDTGWAHNLNFCYCVIHKKDDMK